MVQGNNRFIIWVFVINYDPYIGRYNKVSISEDFFREHGHRFINWYTAVCRSEICNKDPNVKYDFEQLEFEVTSSNRKLFEINGEFHDSYFLLLGAEKVYWLLRNQCTTKGELVDVRRANTPNDHINDIVLEFKRVFKAHK